jgi:hypothetical protein
VPTNNSKTMVTDIRWFTSRYSVVKVLNHERGSLAPKLVRTTSMIHTPSALRG